MSAHRTDGDAQPAFRPLESITILGIIGILGLALGLFALTRPTTTTTQHKLAYMQSGSFNYSATAPASSIYGAKGLSTGEPIISKLVGPVHVGFNYRLSADLPSRVSGTATIEAKVDLGQGLSKVFPIAPEQSFTGNRTSLSGTLPLAAINSYIAAANHDLGGATPSGITVTVQPEIKVSGAVGGHTLAQTGYAPTLPFALTGSTLAIASPDAGNDPSAPVASPLKPSASGSIGYDASSPNTVPLLFLHPSVNEARIIGVALAALCLLLCIWLARPLRAGRSPGDRDRIRALYGAHLVPVEAVTAHTGPVADVTSMEALADLAKRYEAVIMHVAADNADTYAVWDNGILYRYTSLIGDVAMPRPREPGDRQLTAVFPLDLWESETDADSTPATFASEAETAKSVTGDNRSGKKRSARSSRERKLESNGARGRR